MANQVKLTFAGDASSLERTFTSVGSGASTMGDRVSRASKEASSGFDRMGGAADGATTHFRGTADVVDGLGTVLGNTALGPVAGLAMGFADIADGLGTTFIPVLQKLGARLAATTVGTWAVNAATTAWTVAQGALNVVLSLNPIGLVVIALAALVAGFILAWKHSETFRNVVRGAMESVGNAVGWVLDRFRGLWEFIRDLPGRISSALKGVATTVTNMIPGTGIVKSIIDKIPGFAMGGVVGGALGQPQLAVVHGGETISRAGQGAGGGVTVIVQGNVLDGRQLGQLVSDAQRQNSRRGFA